jgi:hypothetical protein
MNTSNSDLQKGSVDAGTQATSTLNLIRWTHEFQAIRGMKDFVKISCLRQPPFLRLGLHGNVVHMRANLENLCRARLMRISKTTNPLPRCELNTG